jgi:hypothetical protein
MRGDLEQANEVLPSIPKEHHNRYENVLSLALWLQLDYGVSKHVSKVT